jgi:hypothetical protein
MSRKITYPLYENLNKKTINKTDINMDFVVSTINSIYKDMKNEKYFEHYQEILFLIIHHYSLTNHLIENSIPYEMKTMKGGNGILIFVNKLPIELISILEEYLLENM